MTQAQIGVTGLAVMGANLARNFARHGYTVAVHNRSQYRTKALVEEYGHEGAFVAGHRRGVRRGAGAPAARLIMVQGGRADRRGDRGVRAAAGAGRHDHRRRQRALRRHPAPRGGAARARHPLRRRRRVRRRGGRAARAEHHARRLEGVVRRLWARCWRTIAAKVDGAPCCTHIGPDGAGHFVKMVHNGIEYADMQLIAEAYDLLRQGLGADPGRDRATSSRSGTRAGSTSYLIEITAEVLAQVDAATGKPFVDVIVRPGRAEGHRPLDGADRAGPGRPGDRHRRGGLRPRAVRPRGAARRGSRGAAGGPTAPTAGRAGDGSPRTYGRRCTPRRSSPTPRGSTRSGPAAPSTAGTSTWARWPRSGAAAASSGPTSWTASARPTTREPEPGDPAGRRRTSPTAIAAAQEAWRRVVAHGGASWASRRPAFSAALAYYDALRAERLPAALIQGQRDFFGAHTYRRVDREGSFHTLWSGDRSEIEA